MASLFVVLPRLVPMVLTWRSGPPGSSQPMRGSATARERCATSDSHGKSTIVGPLMSRELPAIVLCPEWTWNCSNFIES